MSRCVRHLYKPLLSRGYTTFKASFLVFLVSALLHEYLVSVPLRMFKYYAFLGMLLQVNFLFNKHKVQGADLNCDILKHSCIKTIRYFDLQLRFFYVIIIIFFKICIFFELKKWGKMVGFLFSIFFQKSLFWINKRYFFYKATKKGIYGVEIVISIFHPFFQHDFQLF